MTKAIRFAPLISVSTEKQSEVGESLAVQKSDIQRAVKNLGGIIPGHRWKYCGQEHATPDNERAKFKQLLLDSTKDLFDAIIVTDESRWGRDNKKSKEAIEILRDNEIMFFVMAKEYELHDPQSLFMLGVTTEFNEYAVRHLQRKSIRSRIAKAMRGIPTSGKLPYGRLFDKKTEIWAIDPEKEKIIKDAANRYLDGKAFCYIW